MPETVPLPKILICPIAESENVNPPNNYTHGGLRGAESIAVTGGGCHDGAEGFHYLHGLLIERIHFVSLLFAILRSSICLRLRPRIFDDAWAQQHNQLTKN